MQNSPDIINIGIYFPTYGSGGARRHLAELLSRWVNERDICFTVYGPEKLKRILPDSPKIKFQRVKATERSMLSRFVWEFFYSYSVFRNLSVLFIPLGSYIGFANPFVTMSRNLMLYDKQQIKKITKPTERFATHVNRYVQLFTFRNASKIIFISKYAQDWIGKMHHSFRLKSSVVHHGVGSGFFLSKREHTSISAFTRECPFKILYVSSFYEYKNHKILLESTSRIAQKYPIQLLLVGTFPDRKKEYEFQELFKEYNHRLRYEMVKYYPELSLIDVIEHYHKADLFVFPSSVENMPNVLLEAMASGLPIASSSLQPMPEFLDDCGIYFNIDDPESIEKSLVALITNVEARLQYSEKAVSRARSYSWDKSANLTLKILKEISRLKKK